MKAGYCLRCAPHKRERCEQTQKVCWLVDKELKRIEAPRRKHRIELVCECEMTASQQRWWNKVMYGAEEAPPERP